MYVKEVPVSSKHATHCHAQNSSLHKHATVGNQEGDCILSVFSMDSGFMILCEMQTLVIVYFEHTNWYYLKWFDRVSENQHTVRKAYVLCTHIQLAADEIVGHGAGNWLFKTIQNEVMHT